MQSSANHSANGLTVVPTSVLAQLLDRVDRLTQMVEQMYERETSRPEIDPKARYHLSEAADYLGTSPSTLKRRAKLHKFVILYDGKTPFVMGAEVLRYAREGATRKNKPGKR